ncbi:hypothetical protein AUC71_12395 [Methyloceanibacter marginalis]|uniref:Uncharacterized protein n=1 Tax=Methyloceanibacter marginalis TaxID=1774971 RepID=A0A1E3WD00_9HYPH|nr:hypothetical protein AUC71_12395 [Methyloceanibacter marginalis]
MAGFGGHGLDLGGRQSQPVHAAVDMDRARQRLAGARAIVGPLFDFLGAVQHRAKARGVVGLRRSGQEAAEDIDGRFRQQRAQRFRLGECRHEKCAAAGAPQRGRGLRHAKTVGVGLDHRGAFGRAAKSRNWR